MTWVLANKCIEFQQHRFMQTNKKTLKLPLELDTLKNSKMITNHAQSIQLAENCPRRYCLRVCQAD